MAVIEGLRVRPQARRRAAPRPGRRVVRLAQPNEAAVLSCLHHSLARDTFLFEESIAAGAAAGAIVLVCEVSEAIAGYLCVGDPRLVLEPADLAAEAGCVVDGSHWTLRAFGVAPQFRRTAVATDLWRAALDRFPASASRVGGSTRSDLVAALDWYSARGFDLDPADPAALERRFSADVEVLRANLTNSRG